LRRFGWFGELNLATLFMMILVTVIVCALAFLFYKFLAVESSIEDPGSAKRKKLLSESIEQLPFDLQTAGGDSIYAVRLFFSTATCWSRSIRTSASL